MPRSASFSVCPTRSPWKRGKSLRSIASVHARERSAIVCWTSRLRARLCTGDAVNETQPAATKPARSQAVLEKPSELNDPSESTILPSTSGGRTMAALETTTAASTPESRRPRLRAATEIRRTSSFSGADIRYSPGSRDFCSATIWPERTRWKRRPGISTCGTTLRSENRLSSA